MYAVRDVGAALRPHEKTHCRIAMRQCAGCRCRCSSGACALLEPDISDECTKPVKQS
jgi:hypothetical protein